MNLDAVGGSDHEYQPSETDEVAGSDAGDEQSGNEKEKEKEKGGGSKRKRSEVGGKKKGKRKGKGSRKRRRAKVDSDDDDDDDGTGAGPGDWMPYWHPDCKRNGHRYVALQAMRDVQWTRKAKVEMMRTGGLKGVVGYMGAGFGGTSWATTVDSWAKAVVEAGELESVSEGVSFPVLIRRCSVSIQRGVAASFFAMVSYVQLFLKAMRYVLVKLLRC